MSTIPSHPHFFKVILSEFMTSIEIPGSFSKFSGTGESFSGKARLIRAGKEWRVKIEVGSIAHGWRRFARDNHLKAGDFVMFEPIGEMKLMVYAFDGVTQCGFHPHQQSAAVVSTSVKRKEKISDGGIAEGSPRNFVVELMPSHLAYKALSVPMNFVWSNGLHRKRSALFRDENRMDWPVNLKFCTRPNPRLRIFGGWTSFAKAKRLRQGDKLKVELIENGEVPIMLVTINGN